MSPKVLIFPCIVFGVALFAPLIAQKSAAPVVKEAVTTTKPDAPKVTLTVDQLVRLGNSAALGKLAAQDFPAVTAFRLKRILDIIAPEIKRAVESESKLFTPENSETVGSVKQIKKEFLPAFQAAYAPLAVEKVELPIAPLSLEADLPGAKLSAQDIADLGPLLVIPGDSPK